MSAAARAPHVVFVVVGEYGGVAATLPLARALSTLGHRVTYVSFPAGQQQIEEAGYAFRPLALGDTVRGRGRRLLQEIWDLRHRAAHDTLAELAPSCALVDILLESVLLAALGRGVPAVHINPTYAHFASWSRPPVRTGLVPRPGPLQALRVGWRWLPSLLAAHTNGEHRRQRRRFARNGVAVRPYEHGVKAVLPEIVLLPRELDFAPGAAPERHYLGWSEMTCTLAAPPPAVPRVYCSLGLTGEGAREGGYLHRRRFYRAVLEAFAAPGSAELVLVAGAMATDPMFLAVPPHVRVVERAAQRDELQRSDLFISHGGANSTREALQAGVPMLVYPCNNDQHGMAARLTAHGLAGRGRIAQVTGRSLRRAATDVMHGSYRDRIRSFQRRVAESGDFQRTVAFVHELAGGARGATDTRQGSP